MLELSILAGAKDDLDEAYNWYESKEIGLGDRFLSYVEDGFSLIRQHPKSFLSAPWIIVAHSSQGFLSK
jgi:hypothetical protein